MPNVQNITSSGTSTASAMTPIAALTDVATIVSSGSGAGWEVKLSTVIEAELDEAHRAWSQGLPGSLERCRALEAELAAATAPAPAPAKAKPAKAAAKRTAKRTAKKSSGRTK